MTSPLIGPLARRGSTAAAELFKSDRVAVGSLRVAKAYWRRKLRARAREQAVLSERSGSD